MAAAEELGGLAMDNQDWSRNQSQTPGEEHSGGCLGFLTILAFGWLFFTLMYFFTERIHEAETGKLEFAWRFFAGPVNFLF
jgi:hypothetical protein